MNTNQLLEALSSSTFSKQEMIDFIDESLEDKQKLVAIMLLDHHPQSWRATWIMAHFVAETTNTVVINPDDILDVVLLKKDGHQRELLKVIYQLPLTDEQEGKLFNICITLWETVSKSSSVRVTAFKGIVTTVRNYPDLYSEISFLVQSQYMDSLSPGILNTCKKLFSSLQKK